MDDAPSNGDETPLTGDRGAVDQDGSLRLPEAWRRRWGLTPGAGFQVEETPHGLLLRPADLPLRKVYVEPTTACNPDCPICVRYSWDESVGVMPMATYRRLVEGLRGAPALLRRYSHGFTSSFPRLPAVIRASFPRLSFVIPATSWPFTSTRM